MDRCPRHSRLQRGSAWPAEAPRSRRAALALAGLAVPGIRLAAAAAPLQPIQPQWAPSQAPASASRPGMTLTFAEEFSSFVWSVSGLQGWRTNFPYGRTLPANKEAQYYSDASVGVHPFRLERSVLEITASPGTNRAGLPHNSGMISSKGGFAQRYGYFEMRARLPRGRGLWPAFWLLPADNSWPPEIDVVEMLGHKPGELHANIRSKVMPRQGLAVTVGDVSNDFHTYGVSWRADEVLHFFDGRQIARFQTPADMHKPMFLLANLAVGGAGSWPGPPDADTVFPARMLIDHIRAWSFDADQ
ncbi:glycoside hydrolase family 16 protein [Dankookia sp. P2]|uniref:glycoside hydrolase family 16 protein n=1 Tax=Dankookia sp. P2 TaxID=3423955 RepID=UPI003D67AC0C